MEGCICWRCVTECVRVRTLDVAVLRRLCRDSRGFEPFRRTETSGHIWHRAIHFCCTHTSQWMYHIRVSVCVWVTIHGGGTYESLNHLCLVALAAEFGNTVPCAMHPHTIPLRRSIIEGLTLRREYTTAKIRSASRASCQLSHPLHLFPDWLVLGGALRL